MKGLIMRFRTLLVLTLVMITPTLAAADIISQKAFNTCIIPAVTDTSSLENLAVDYSLAPDSAYCAKAISEYGNAHGNLVGANDVTRALVAVTRKAIDDGMVPQTGNVRIASASYKPFTVTTTHVDEDGNRTVED